MRTISIATVSYSDGWQAKAGGEVLKDKNVIVCAPTGMFECYWIQLQPIFCTKFLRIYIIQFILYRSTRVASVLLQIQH